MKKVLLTGISTGLGNFLTKQLLKNDFSVIGIDIQYPSNFKADIEEGRLTFYKQDLSESDKLIGFLNGVYGEHKEVDILINNAAILNFKHFSKLTYDEIAAMISVNLLAPILITKFFYEQMVNNNSGKIINISSVSAFRGTATTSIYAATKSGLNRFHQGIVKEKQRIHKNSNVTINTLCPDRIATPEYLSADPKLNPKKLVSPEALFTIIDHIINTDVDGKIIKIPYFNWRRTIRDIEFVKKVPGLRRIRNL